MSAPKFMTIEQRIKAGAGSFTPIDIEEMGAPWVVEEILRAAVPELFTDPPSRFWKPRTKPETRDA